METRGTFGQSNSAENVMDDSKVASRLLQKHFSPMIVRKYQLNGWPCYVSLICDYSLSDLDKVVYELVDEANNLGYSTNDIQAIRNFTGYLNDGIVNYYDEKKRGCVEGVAVLYYVDKLFCSALFGDQMTHLSCKMELYQIINTLPHI